MKNSFLQRFTNIRREEVGPTLVAGLFFFCVLTALMVIRPAREALGMQRGIEALRWLFMGTVLVTLLVNPLFGWLVSRFRRLVFINATYLFFAVGLVAFYLLLVLTPESVGQRTGQVFYVWFSVFNLFATMLFWALMADRFTLEQSKRLFGAIAVGGTLGAIFGPWLASQLAKPLGTPALLLVAAGFLVLALGAAWWVTRLRPEVAQSGAAREEHAVIGGSAWEGLQSVARSPYLLAICGYVLILAVMATFLYFTRLQMVAALGTDVDMRTTMFAHIDLITQVTTLVLQADRHGTPDEAPRGAGDAGVAAADRRAGLPGPGDRRIARGADRVRGRVPRRAARHHAAGARDALHRGAARRPLQGEGVHRHVRVSHGRSGRRANRGPARAAGHGIGRARRRRVAARRGVDGARPLAGLRPAQRGPMAPKHNQKERLHDFSS